MLQDSKDSLYSSIDGSAQNEEFTKRQQLAAMRSYTLMLIDQLQTFCTAEPPERQEGWKGIIEQFQDAVYFMETAETESPAKPAAEQVSEAQRKEFGKLLRDRRNAAGFSRLQLAHRAKLSDATIKFVETARHPPSRTTLIRLLGVTELQLTWADVPGQQAPTKTTASPGDVPSPATDPGLGDDLNCFITPTIEPVRMVMDLGRFLNGAGGHAARQDRPANCPRDRLCRAELDRARLRGCKHGSSPGAAPGRRAGDAKAKIVPVRCESAAAQRGIQIRN
jgi:transcriptional regulator with XRE-family HTH domain